MYSTFVAEDVSAYITSRIALLDVLKTFVVPNILVSNLFRKPDGSVGRVSQRADVIGHDGRTTNFGIGRIRCKGYGPFANNARYPEVYAALIRFAEKALPDDFIWNALTLNHNCLAKKHKDGLNVGDSYIIGIGDFTGGKLRLYSDECEYEPHDIKDIALRFNGSQIAHETEAFEGNRYTIIFYRQTKADIEKLIA